MIEAQQSDRDTAAILAMDLGADMREFRKIANGEWDHHAAVQAIAETRQQAEDAMRDVLRPFAAVVEYIPDDKADTETEAACFKVSAFRRAATAIRATQARPAEQRG